MYECKRCGKEFETPNVWLEKELCPCGSDDIVKIEEDEPKSATPAKPKSANK